ncbi:hypothetical protein LSTR_LSTR017371 [Laodelphax striatellus]|uniref:CUB domain-containing protein n=1 Tax=Laodelphax striatellus TaxID=195883 RepID=A0A482WP70_LAOST|nr:hypothetical protein LSTR_LSTR017371 [Laodelphax striatellus]
MNSNITQGGTFSSPFFPVQYSRDYNAEYVVTCEADASLNCRIRVVFSDFLLADMSIMEVIIITDSYNYRLYNQCFVACVLLLALYRTGT